MVPVLSLDLHARLAVTGSYNAEGQGVLGLTQAQVEEYVRQGYGHAVVGLPTPWVDRYDEAVTAARQEISLLSANGVAVDAYRYLYWRENGRPRTAEDVYRDVWAALDSIKGQPVGTFWLDVESHSELNPALRNANGEVDVEATQELVAAAHQAFVDWKAARLDALEEREERIWNERLSRLPPEDYAAALTALSAQREQLQAMQVGMYTSASAWTELMGGTDTYAKMGLPAWVARYPSTSYTPGADLAGEFGARVEDFGGWSVGDGTIVGWQWSDGRGDRRQDFSETDFAVDRSIFYVAASRLPAGEKEAEATDVADTRWQRGPGAIPE